MKKKFLLTLFYTSYLIMLGQGCSALKTEEEGLLLRIPTLNIPDSMALPTVPKVTISKVSEIAPADVFEEGRVELKAAEVINKTQIYKDSSYRFEKQKLSEPKRSVGVVNNKKAITFLAPLEKGIIVQEFKSTKITKEQVKSSIQDIEPTVRALDKNLFELNNKMGFEHNGFKVEINYNSMSTAWISSLSDGLSDRLASIAKEKMNTKIAEVSEDNFRLSSNNEFVNDENDFTDIIKKTESSVSKKDDLVFLDYSKKNSIVDNTTKEERSAEELKAPDLGDISSRVRSVINREMAIETKSSQASGLMAMASKQSSDTSGINQLAQQIYGQRLEGGSKKQGNLKNQATLYAIESDLEKGFQESVTNFDFIPGHDSNNSLRDFNEGSITVDYSLVNQTGIFRGTILKNYYMRTTFEIPLGSEYSKFEVPLIPKDSLGSYLDKNDLDGYGGYFLVDLGDLIEDVDVEKTSNDKVSPYEHRLLLNENFKPVKTGSDYRYVLFIGVVPGSINVRYLGVNGQETSKLTFITADEVSYDFSQIERPHLLSFRTRVRNTLGMSTSPLDLSVASITSFLDEVNPVKISESSYEIKIPWSVKGMRNYFRFDYLEDNIFVGVDRDQDIELPSKEFISEILKSFNMDSLGAECILQMNFSEVVTQISIQAESEKGPANFDHTYLDRDGVFSPEISPLSQKYFAVGYEEGIFSIKVSYEDGRTDYLRTYCSPSTYLLEQL